MQAQPIINGIIPQTNFVILDSSQVLTTAGLVINGAGNPTAKIGAADCYALTAGRLTKIAAGTAMPALVGVIPATQYNVFCFFVDSTGALTSVAGTPGATIGAVTFPQIPVGKAMLGFILVTYASTFTGGTTPLDTATTLYFSPTGGFDASAIVQ